MSEAIETSPQNEAGIQLFTSSRDFLLENGTWSETSEGEDGGWIEYPPRNPHNPDMPQTLIRSAKITTHDEQEVRDSLTLNAVPIIITKGEDESKIWYKLNPDGAVKDISEKKGTLNKLFGRQNQAEIMNDVAAIINDLKSSVDSSPQK